jgi:hypothetical protein
MMKQLALLALANLASAQVGAYGQCGGSGYSGSTTCMSGWTCQYQNEWYSQCVTCESSKAFEPIQGTVGTSVDINQKYPI